MQSKYSQRQQYRLMKEVKKSRMTEYISEALEDIEFAWQMKGQILAS